MNVWPYRVNVTMDTPRVIKLQMDYLNECIIDMDIICTTVCGRQ